MITAKTKKGTKVYISFVKDVEPNKGGYYCEISRYYCGSTYDNFCIHPEDCDCNNEAEVGNFAKNYVSTIEEY